MQTTLLGLAIALILALVTALVGPLLVDWGTYRSLFETQASHLAGVPVKVTGAIDARLLPSPQLTLHDIEIGDADKVRARSLGIEFSLGPLLRGEWRASEMQLVGPQVTLGLDASGRVQTPTIDVGFDPDALTIDRISVEDGTVTLADAASGGRITLDKLWFIGEARSLLGPFKGEGAVTLDGELYPYRVSAGRYAEDNGLKLRVNVDPVSRPLSIEIDAALKVTTGVPRLDGNFTLARPVGIGGRGAPVTQPWRVTGKIKAGAQSALLQNIEFQHGGEEQGTKLTGVAEFKFGKKPRFDGVLSSRQLDLDRALTGRDGVKPAPAAALRQLAELGGAAFRPAFPIQLGIGIDQVTLGGSTVQNVRGDISSVADGWNLDRFEFRAPGFTQVRLSGHLAINDGSVAFTGPAEIDAGDPKAMTAWLEGRGDTGQGDLKPLSLRGEVTLGTERVAVEQLRAEFDRKTISGRLAYVFAAGQAPAKLDAELNAPDLDIDAALGFGKALMAGSKMERPRQMTLTADIGRATVAGFTGSNASARLKIDSDGVQIDKLSVADLGGAAFSASGRIVTSGTPQGSVRVELDAPDVQPVLALLSRFAPDTAQALQARAATMAPAKLRALLSLEGAAPRTQGKIDVEGNLGKVKLAFNGQGRVDPATFTATDLQIDAKLNADDGRALVTMLGLDGVVAAEPGAGALTLKASGPARGTLRIDGRVAAAGFEASANGTANLYADQRAADLRLAIVRANAAPLRAKGAVRQALPVTYTGRLGLAGQNLTLSDINAGIAGSNVRGRLAVVLSEPRRVQGELEADRFDGAALVGAAIGMAASPASAKATWSWPSEPFSESPLPSATGKIALKARQVDLLPHAQAREFKATVTLGQGSFAVDDATANVAGGKLNGRLGFRAAADGLKLQGKFALTGADAAALLASGARPSVTGTLGLTAEVDGSGLSPVALIGSLKGTGNVTLANAQFAGLDPRAFDAVTRAVDQGIPIDNARIAEIVRRALESGQLSVKQAQGPFEVSAGQVRLGNVSAESKDATVSLSGNLDMIDGSIDARLVLSGTGDAAGARPDIFMALGGQLSAPAHTIDVSALTGWLTLRSVENQAKRLQAIERATLKPEMPVSAPPVSAPAVPAAGTAPPLSPPLLPPATPLATPTVAPDALSPHVKELAPALPPPLDVRPYPGPARAVRPEASVGPQN